MENKRSYLKTPLAVGSIVQDFFIKQGLESKVKEYQIMNKWDQLVGPKIAKISSPEKVTNGLLYIKVSNQNWITHLQFMKPTILNKIHTFLANDSIKDVYFKLDNRL